jgi:hypothetical protein
LLKTSSRSELGARSYERPKSWESKPGQFWDSTLGVMGKRAIWMQVRQRAAENTIWGKVVASPSPSRGELSEFKVARGLSQH